jgi:aminoglycoside phosphotransferase (APT) family kinase protein
MTDMALVRLLEECLSAHWQSGVTIDNVKQLTGGAASQTTAFDAWAEGQLQPLILRCGDDEHQFENALTKPTEAALLELVYQQRLPVPEVIAHIPASNVNGAGFVMRRLAGEALPKRILTDARFATARELLAGQCGAVLASLHNIDPRRAAMLESVSVEDDVLRYRERYREFGQCLPVFDLAFRYLLDTPPTTRQAAIVHGDFRNGNILVDEQGLSGVLDWELAHIGNPIEDLGWLCVNSWRFGHVDKAVGGFGDKRALLDTYNRGRDTDVSEQELAYWEVFGVLKWGVICLYQSAIHLQGKQRSVERAVIGRRLSECEADLIRLLKEH